MAQISRLAAGLELRTKPRCHVTGTICEQRGEDGEHERQGE